MPHVHKLWAAAHRLLAATAAAALILGSAGCGMLGGSGDEVPKGFVSVSVTQPADLLPSQVGDAGGLQLLGALFTPLVTYNPAHEPVEAAARAITSTDRRTWTITLADGYTFHTGEKVTSQSYLDAWNFAAYGPHRQRNSYLFERIEGFVEMQGAQPVATTLSGLKRIDDLTFTVTLVTPFVEFPAMLGHPAFSPLPTTAFSAPGVVAAGFADAMVGQGPFKLTKPITRGEPIDVQRYDAAVVKAKVAGVRFQVYSDQVQAYTAFTDGDLDVVTNIPDNQVRDATRELGGRLTSTPGSSLTMLAFPSYDRELGEPAVRRAISMAIDRDTIVNTLFPGAELPARSFTPPPVRGYKADSCGTACIFDPAAAKVAYQRAGGPRTLRISYNSDGGHQQWVAATCAQLSTNLGVTCTGVSEPTFSDQLAKVRAQKPVGLFRMTWFMDYPSMDSYLSPLFDSDGSSNFERYQDPDFDAAVRDATGAADLASATAAYGKAQEILAQDMPVIPLRFSLNVTGHSTRVTGVAVDVFDRIDVTQLQLS